MEQLFPDPLKLRYGVCKLISRVAELDCALIAGSPHLYYRLG